MSRERSNRAEWLLTVSVVAAVAAGLVGMRVFTRAAERRQHEQAAQVSRLAGLELIGQPAAPVDFILDRDTVRFPVTGAPALLYVRNEECTPCERTERDLRSFLRNPLAGDPGLWVLSEAGTDEARVAFSEFPQVRVGRAADLRGFAHAYQVRQVPFLALVSADGRIQRVRVGDARGFDLRGFVRGSAIRP